MTDNNHVVRWDRCLLIIRDNIAEATYNTIFKSIVPVGFDGKTLTLGVPSRFIYEILEEHYVDLLSKVIYREFGEGTRLMYRILVDKENKITNDEESDGAEDKVEERQVKGANRSPQLPVPQDLDSRLIPRYRFDNFIEGVSNKLTRSAGEAVAQNPGQEAFNPFFIYGPSGVGKTHLANAIGARVKELYPNKRVLYVSAHLFQVQYTNAVRENNVNNFIHFYQTIDVLIIDDVQEFATLTKTQNTFFHIFNHLHQLGKQLIMTSDRSPMMLQGMEERMLTRFKWGLVAEMEKPNVDLRKSILRKKVSRDGLAFPERVIDYIAENVDESVRDLEGVVNSLMARSVVFGRDVDMDLAQLVVRQSARVIERKPLSVEDILDKVCAHYGVDATQIASKTRKREVVQVRQIAMYLAKKHTEASTSRIGKLIGKRDHATVLHACSVVTSQLEVDKRFKSEVEELETTLRTK